MKAGIEEMSVIREWRSALVNAVQNGFAVTDDFAAAYRGQAAKNLRSGIRSSFNRFRSKCFSVAQQ